MSKYIVTIVLAVSLCSCTDQNDKGFVDEIHRPQDWQAEFNLVLFPDTILDEEELIRVEDQSSNTSIYDLVDQLFDLAFSGDAKVYLPSVFGEKDLEQQIDPIQLQKALEEYDTTSVEDLYSSGFIDTVVDLSFKKGAVSALQIKCGFGKKGEQVLMVPTDVMIGEQVFSETGIFRGYRPRFFVELNQKEHIEFDAMAELTLATDSLGLFRVVSFSSYNEDLREPLHEFFQLNDSKKGFAKFIMAFNFRESSLSIPPFIMSLEPYQGEES